MKEVASKFLVWLNGLVSGTGGDGQSGTKLMYLVAGLGSAFAATIMTLVAACVGMFAVAAPFLLELFKKNGEACPHIALDGVFWSAYFTCLGGLWISIFGYATSAKKHAADATKEITIADMTKWNSAPTPPATTTTEVTASRTTITPGAKKK